MKLRTWMYVLLGCVAWISALPAATRACQYGVRFSVEDVPANGLVQLTWLCLDRFCTQEYVPNPLRIVDAETMADVPGTVVWTQGAGTMVLNVFWRPAAPLVVGRSYHVGDLPEYVSSSEFTALPAVQWLSTAELEFEAALEITGGLVAGDVTCPLRYPQTRCPPNEKPSPSVAPLRTRWQTSLWLGAYATHSMISRVPPLKRRSVYWREGEAPPDLHSKPWSLGEPEPRFTEQAVRYCYRSGVQNLLDGSERVWEGCLEHGDLPPLDTREAARAEVMPETEQCAEPPAGYENEWCEQSMLACQREYTKPSPADCENVAKRCAAMPEPADDEDAGASEDDPPESRRARRPAPRYSGCSVPVGPTGGSPQLLLLAALAAAAILRRKRA
ncbi:MAG TPA: hypothetical protein VJR89_25185 [Polyangiales bacterium]|nr:hypothetical protein [Polyangiales bacterium]